MPRACPTRPLRLHSGHIHYSQQPDLRCVATAKIKSFFVRRFFLPTPPPSTPPQTSPFSLSFPSRSTPTPLFLPSPPPPPSPHQHTALPSLSPSVPPPPLSPFPPPPSSFRPLLLTKLSGEAYKTGVISRIRTLSLGLRKNPSPLCHTRQDESSRTIVGPGGASPGGGGRSEKSCD